MRHGRHGGHRRRRLRRLVGYIVVGIVSLAMLLLLIWCVRQTPGGDIVEPNTGAGQIGDVWIGDSCYERRRDLVNVLFIAVGGENAVNVHPLAVNPRATHLAILTIDEANRTFYITTLSSGLHAEVSPVNEFGSVSTDTLSLGDGATLGLAQAFGDGRRHSCLNTTRTVEKLLDVMITNQVCIATDGDEEPIFLTDPRAELADLKQRARRYMGESQRSSFETAMSNACIYTDFRNEFGMERILDQLGRYDLGGTYELSAGATRAEVDALRAGLFLKKLPGAAARSEPDAE